MYLMLMSEIAGVVKGKEIQWESEQFRKVFETGNRKLFWLTEQPRDFRFSKQYREYVWNLRP